MWSPSATRAACCGRCRRRIDGVRVLFATSECVPWVKTGGLGDVAGALPAALRRNGIDVRVLLPAYRSLAARANKPVAAIDATPRLPAATLLDATLPTGVP